MTCPLWPGAKREEVRPALAASQEKTVITVPFFLSLLLIIYLFPFPPFLVLIGHVTWRTHFAPWFPSYRYLVTVTRIARSMGQSAYLGYLDHGVPARAVKQGRLAGTYSILAPSRSTARPSIHPINRTAAQPDLVALPGERRREQKKKTRERGKKSRPSHRQAAGPPIILPHRLYGTLRLAGSY